MIQPIRGVAVLADVILRGTLTSNFPLKGMLVVSKRETPMSSRLTDSPGDAIALLRAEHCELLDQFQRFLRLPSHEREHGWRALHKAISVHMAIEAELLYPAFLDATEDSLVHFVASLGHENIMAQIRDVWEVPSSGGYFASRVRSLKRIFAHHVWDMERNGGLFDEASRSTINHELLARMVRARYAALQAAAEKAPITVDRVGSGSQDFSTL